jgi:hypothetical protein
MLGKYEEAEQTALKGLFELSSSSFNNLKFF